MSQALSRKTNEVIHEPNLADITDLLEFVLIAIFDWLIVDYLERELIAVGVVPLYAVIARWGVFIVILLIYYGLIRVHIRVKVEKEL
jgi:hypothetical protein